MPLSRWRTSSGHDAEPKKELHALAMEDDLLANAAQCYLSPQHLRSKVLSPNASPKTARRPLLLPALSSPVASDQQRPTQSGLPSPGVASPGTVILAPSRPVGHDLDLPMIDQICRSSFRAHKALLKWQRNVLATHRREWDRAGKHEARCRSQLWRKQRSRSRKVPDGSEESPAHARSVRKVAELQDEGDSPGPVASSASLLIPQKEEGAGTSRTATPRSIEPEKRVNHTPRSAAVAAKVAKAVKPEQNQHRLRDLMKRRQEKRSQRIAAATKMLEAMPPEERDALHMIFANNAGGKDVLMGVEVHRAVLEAGLVGHDAAERRKVAWTCHPPGRQWEEEGLTFAEFATQVFPACRSALAGVRQEKLHKLLASSPREWTGRVSKSRLLDALKEVLPADYPGGEDSEETSGEILQEIVRQYSEGAEGFSLPEIAAKLQAMSEEWWRLHAEEKRSVQARWDLDEDTYNTTGNEIVHLDSIFQRVGGGGKGYLERDEVETLFDELGVVPQSLMQKRKTLGLLNEQSTYDFVSFIKLVHKIRSLIIGQEDKQLHSSYMRMAAENAKTAHAATRRAMRRIKLSTMARSLEDVDQGTQQHQNMERDFHEQVELQEIDECGQLITYDQLVALLMEAAVIPDTSAAHQTFRRRRLVGREVMSATKAVGRLERIMQDVDPGSRQLFSYPEVRLVLQRMREETRQEARVVEAKHIRDMGYKPEQVQDMRAMFSKLDPHGTGLLTEVQVELALNSLGVHLSHQACCAVAFRVFDFDLSGSIDFLEFLNMMTMARLQDGCFKPLDSQLVTTLSKLDRGDLLLLLTVMRVPNSRLDGISDTRLLYEAAELLKIGADKELPPIIGGRSLSVLVRYAEKMLMRGGMSL